MKGLKLIEGCYLIAIFLAIGGVALSFSALFIPVARVLLFVGLAVFLVGLMALVMLRTVTPSSKAGGKDGK